MNITGNTEAESSNSPSRQSALVIIDKCIANLKEESAKIVEICAKLSRFLHTNAITPFNDDIIEYVYHFIREEQEKEKAGAKNAEVIKGLENMVSEYTRLMDISKQTMQDHQAEITDDPESEPLLDGMLELIETLFNLPMNGFKIREQVEGLEFNQMKFTQEQEQHVVLPLKAASSNVMHELESVICENTEMKEQIAIDDQELHSLESTTE